MPLCMPHCLVRRRGQLQPLEFEAKPVKIERMFLG
jgi:hypothetical protein